MNIRGFQKVSLIDYPGKVAAVVFTAGCNFRCPYCYNRDLVLGSNSLETIPEEEIFEYLSKRKSLVDGVVITGGEPTLQKDLLEFINKIKRLDFLVKLDTNGSSPTIIQFMVIGNLVDYIALDVKAPLNLRYAESAGLENFDVSSILRSMKELANSDVDFELRTTIVPGLHLEKDLLDLAKQLQKIAPRARWFLQNFQPKNCLDPEFEKVEPYDNIFFENLVAKLKTYMPAIQVR